MKSRWRVRDAICLVCISSFTTSCSALSPTNDEAIPSTAPQCARLTGIEAIDSATDLKPVAFQPTAGTDGTIVLAQGSPFARMAELSVDEFVQQVLARNPSLYEMIAAWQAAQARYPQVTSLDDPMFGGTIGPETIHPDDPGVEFASRWEISQKYPWPGKLRLRGENALAEANAAGREVDDIRLQLIEAARIAFYDYYLAERALEVNQENLRLLKQFREDAMARYRSPTALEKRVSFQDVLQANVEIGREQDRKLALEQARQIVIARINTLMRLPPDAPLPPPPKELRVGDELPPPQMLRAFALARRPDLQALADRIAAEQAALALAYREFYPDLEPFFMYDRFMGNTSRNRDLASMLGVKLNLPVRYARRNAAVAEAQARINQRRAELAKQTDQVSLQVQEAYDKVLRREKSVRLYEEKILRDARANVKAAREPYITGLIPALTLFQAERDLVNLEDRYYETVADYFRQRAALERAVGGPLVDVSQTPDSAMPGR